MKHLVHILQKLGSFNMWRNMVNFWSIIFFAAILYDFFNENVLSRSEILLGISAIYAASLAIYSAEKEFRRWHNMHSGVHPGEMYAMIWTALVLFVVITSIVTKIPYHMPIEVSASYIAVISILAITRESKNFYKRRRGK